MFDPFCIPPSVHSFVIEIEQYQQTAFCVLLDYRIDQMLMALEIFSVDVFQNK